MNRFAVPALVVCCGLLLGGAALSAGGQGARAATATLQVCTDATWVEPSTGLPAVVQPDGPAVGGVHDIPAAAPIWGQDSRPFSETTLVKQFTLPDEATAISATARFVADDGVVFFVNGQEIGRFDAMVWPPPTEAGVANLVPGENTITAEVYNRPSVAWLEACLAIRYDPGAGGHVALLPALFNVGQPPPTPPVPTPPVPTPPASTPTATRPASANLLIGNMPLPTGWDTQGPETYWEGLLRVQDEERIEIRVLDCGDDSGNGVLDVLRVYDPGGNLIVDRPNCSGNPVIPIVTAGKPGYYRVFMQDNDTGGDGNGGNIWVDRLRDQRVYADPSNPALAAANMLTQVSPLPADWAVYGLLTYWEGFIRVQNEPAITVRATDCGDDEGDGRLDAIQITDPSGLIVGGVSGCDSSLHSFPINTAGKPGWYRIYFLDKDTGPARATAGNGGSLSVEGLVDQQVYPAPGGPASTPTVASTPTASPTPPAPGGWGPVGAGSASGGGISDNSGDSRGVAVAAGPGGVVYVAWHDTSAGDAEIYLRRWDGTSWGALGGSASGGGISDNSGDSLWPAVAVGPDGRPWVAWHDTSSGRAQIYARRWTGSAWAEVGAGSASGGGISNTGGASEYVDLRVGANGDAYVVWTDDSPGNSEVYGRMWNGSGWVALGGSASGGGISNNSGRSGRPALALDGAGRPVVAWTEGSGGKSNIYARRWSGSAWAEMGAGSASGGGISQSAGRSQYPTLAFSAGGEAYLAWYDDSGGQGEIMAAVWDGSRWSSAAGPGGVSATNRDSREPNVAVSPSGVVYVAWQESAAGGDTEVYIRRRDGGSWVEAGAGSASGGGLSDNSGDSNFPALVFAGGRLYVAWEDDSGGDFEVYVLRE